MELSSRLKTVADMVKYPTMADIGTDHGYVPIYLHKHKKITKALACDINKGPLAKAKENVQKNHAENVIETRLGSGLLPVSPYEVESVVIAGMGGMLIIQILEVSKEVVRTMKELILSPHSDVAEVRRYLHQIGFSIADERMVKDDGKYYVFLRAVFESEVYEREIDYLFGHILLKKKDTVLREMLEKERMKLQLVERNLCDAKTKNANLRLLEIRKQQEQVKEALECL